MLAINRREADVRRWKTLPIDHFSRIKNAGVYGLHTDGRGRASVVFCQVMTIPVQELGWDTVYEASSAGGVPFWGRTDKKSFVVCCTQYIRSIRTTNCIVYVHTYEGTTSFVHSSLTRH